MGNSQISRWWMVDLFTEVECRMRNGFGREYEGFLSRQRASEDCMQRPRAQESSLSSRWEIWREGQLATEGEN